MSDPNHLTETRLEPGRVDSVADSAAPAAAPRCRLARCTDSDSLTGEIARLLRTRLRVAVSLMLAAFAVNFVRNLWDTATALGGPVGETLHGFVVVAMAGATAVLWSPWACGMRRLRLLEVTIFGLTAVFFTWMHVEFFLLGYVPTTAEGTEQTTLVRLAASANVFRWSMLIVVYGMFIPNTWHRCAAVVGCLALAPILVTAALPWLAPGAGAYLSLLLPDSIVLTGLAASVAVFGSYKVRELHEQVHEAQKFGQYRLKDKLGAGGMGEVYLAEHVLLRRPCAIKLIRPDQAGDPRTLLRFEREVRAAATLTHWNTIEIFDYGHTDDGTFYYVMEYLPGLTLEELVERHGPVPPGRAVYLLRQVCEALREAHGIGLIHRDIKPSNIFACERGKVRDVAKLLDFGLVKTFGLNSDVKLTVDGSLAGSPLYMSPEQAAGQAQLDARSDIYNTGAVGYFLITGRPVFERQTPLQLLFAHAHEPVVPLPRFRAEVPTDLQQVILRCLEKNPTDRYPDAESLERALAACACAGDWTRERAEEWWREVEGKANLPRQRGGELAASSPG